ncbi:uncharacterized protein G2W53_000979 [Senna tora]|uniref:Uncharacterized protein n=1 Tax=Senna tora TaxID=362788 RepID=A0A834XF13_9FABA|nr:uncharacterized protein G2W53_000979 [Senna tora]
MKPKTLKIEDGLVHELNTTVAPPSMQHHRCPTVNAWEEEGEIDLGTF